MVVADLHVHTTNSDGTLSLDDVPAAARRADLDAVAITDHDRPHPELADPVERREGVAVVHGIELRVETADQRVDLLGYGLHPTPELRRECERLQRDRVDRAARIVARVEEHLGIDLDVEPVPGVGRPHVARAIAAHPDADYDVDRAFAELVGDGGPCFVARDVPSFERGRDLLAAASGIVGLAHPLRYEDSEAALALAAGLDAIERCYPYDRPVDPDDPGARGGTEVVDRALDRYDCLATGGSDAHGETLGAAGLDEGAWKSVSEALGVA